MSIDPELAELYQDLIRDHSKSPRNFGELPDKTLEAEGYNPLCGDHFSVFVKSRDGRIEKTSFIGTGCAISTSSASLMTEAIRGQTIPEVKQLFERMHALLVGRPDPGGPELGKLEAFAGVQNFPLRVKCASLAWHTLKAALDGESEPVTTE